MIKLKRTYEPATPDDGVRVLVERLWPRGIKKTSAHLDQWVKEATPSSTLRKWFHHDPTRWDEFRHRYFRELDENEERWRPLLSCCDRSRPKLLNPDFPVSQRTT